MIACDALFVTFRTKLTTRGRSHFEFRYKYIQSEPSTNRLPVSTVAYLSFMLSINKRRTIRMVQYCISHLSDRDVAIKLLFPALEYMNSTSSFAGMVCSYGVCSDVTGQVHIVHLYGLYATLYVSSSTIYGYTI